MRKERIKDNCKLEYNSNTCQCYSCDSATDDEGLVQWVHLGYGHSPEARAAVFSLCARGAVGYSGCDTAGSGAAYENTDTHALKCQSVPVPPRTRPHAVGTPSTGRRDRFFSCAGRIELAAATYIRLCLPPSKRTAPTRSVRAYDHTVSSVHLLSCSRLLSLKSLGRK